MEFNHPSLKMFKEWIECFPLGSVIGIASSSEACPLQRWYADHYWTRYAWEVGNEWLWLPLEYMAGTTTGARLFRWEREIVLRIDALASQIENLYVTREQVLSVVEQMEKDGYE